MRKIPEVETLQQQPVAGNTRIRFGAFNQPFKYAMIFLQDVVHEAHAGPGRLQTVVVRAAAGIAAEFFIDSPADRFAATRAGFTRCVHNKK